MKYSLPPGSLPPGSLPSGSLPPGALRIALAACALLAATACQTPQTTIAPVRANSAEPPVAEVETGLSFADWLEGVRKEALRWGIGQATLAAALAGVTPNPRVVELDGRQPEFSQPFWRYLDGAISDARIVKGRTLMRDHAALLATLERTYGVPGRYLVAFWAMESDFGGNTGGFSVVRSLATLAYDSRRGAYFRGEMLDALTILDRRDIDVAQMTGSWAGAMGQTQFMPSVFLKYAVDQDRDGHRNIWTSVPDALASTANYLKNSGWDGARDWGREVRLPANFDAALASLDSDATETVKTPAQWAALGVRDAQGGALPKTDGPAALVLPAGIAGPAFLVFDDYRAILKYNRSTAYAIAVGILADRFGGGGPLAARHQVADPLKREDILALQQGLSRLGLLPGAPDGVAGTATRQAVRAFQKANGLPPDGYIDQRLMAAVKARGGNA